MAVPAKTLTQRIIAESDLKSERLIAILRMILAAMLFLGVSFVLSQSQSVGLELRAFELKLLLIGSVCYFALGATNYYFATSGRYRPWMSWAFNFGEVILVAVQLYIDVAHPTTPSLVAFASPVVLVAALVICVQALRFQIKLHLFTTLLLFVLCVVILFHDPQIGLPFSDHAQKELQLLYSVPPNMMRLIMLLAMAGLIGTAVYRSMRLIETVARETELAENRKRFLPSEISNALSDDNLNALRTGEDKNIAVLFADIRGFTGISEKIDVRDTVELLTRYRSMITDTVVPRNGVIDKFVGDGALVIFGLHTDVKQACSDAIRASELLLRAMEVWNEENEKAELENIELAIGIHAGPAVIGAIGDDRRLEFTAIGDTINIASRLEELAKQHNHSIVLSRHIVETAEVDANDFTALGSISIRGREDPVEVLAKH